ncbi:MAG: hypothetical protein WC100_20810 [Sterolibacterium sp.]
MALTFAVASAAVVFLTFNATRVFGVVAVLLLICLHPVLFPALIFIGAIVFYLTRNYQRKLLDELFHF